LELVRRNFGAWNLTCVILAHLLIL
jgi:hypothetical protein